MADEASLAPSNGRTPSLQPASLDDARVVKILTDVAAGRLKVADAAAILLPLSRHLADLKTDLAMFTEAQLATIEGLPSRTSERERRRHISIAEEMIASCRRASVPPQEHGWNRRSYSRLSAILSKPRGAVPTDNLLSTKR